MVKKHWIFDTVADVLQSRSLVVVARPCSMSAAHWEMYMPRQRRQLLERRMVSLSFPSRIFLSRVRHQNACNHVSIQVRHFSCKTTSSPSHKVFCPCDIYRFGHEHMWSKYVCGRRTPSVRGIFLVQIVGVDTTLQPYSNP